MAPLPSAKDTWKNSASSGTMTPSRSPRSTPSKGAAPVVPSQCRASKVADAASIGGDDGPLGADGSQKVAEKRGTHLASPRYEKSNDKEDENNTHASGDTCKPRRGTTTGITKSVSLDDTHGSEDTVKKPRAPRRAISTSASMGEKRVVPTKNAALINTPRVVLVKKSVSIGSTKPVASARGNRSGSSKVCAPGVSGDCVEASSPVRPIRQAAARARRPDVKVEGVGVQTETSTTNVRPNSLRGSRSKRSPSCRDTVDNEGDEESDDDHDRDDGSGALPQRKSIGRVSRKCPPSGKTVRPIRQAAARARSGSSKVCVPGVSGDCVGASSPVRPIRQAAARARRPDVKVEGVGVQTETSTTNVRPNSLRGSRSKRSPSCRDTVDNEGDEESDDDHDRDDGSGALPQRKSIRRVSRKCPPSGKTVRPIRQAAARARSGSSKVCVPVVSGDCVGASSQVRPIRQAAARARRPDVKVEGVGVQTETSTTNIRPNSLLGSRSKRSPSCRDTVDNDGDEECDDDDGSVALPQRKSIGRVSRKCPPSGKPSERRARRGAISTGRRGQIPRDGAAYAACRGRVNPFVLHEHDDESDSTDDDDMDDSDDNTTAKKRPTLKDVLKLLMIQKSKQIIVSKVINDILRTIMDAVKKDGQLPVDKLLNTGSYYEKLKISEPDEFDVMLVLVERVNLEEVPGLGGAFYLVTPKRNSALQKFAVGNFISPAKIIKVLENIVKRLLPTLGYNARLKPASKGCPAVTIQLKPMEAEDDVCVDLVPAIKVQNSSWPPEAKTINTSSWLGRKHMAKLFTSKSFYLVGKKPPRNAKGVIEDRAWRISFSEVEKDIVLNHGNKNTCCEKGQAHCCRKECLKLLKWLLESFKKCTPSMQDNLCSYHAKTVWLHACAGWPNDSHWNLKNRLLCFIILLEDFAEAARTGILSHFFLPRYNLFDQKLVTRSSLKDLEWALSRDIQKLKEGRISDVFLQ
ncbi:uncharacterized protein LOC116946569 [Petromyzon marinus]|uniref:uncharacterized protein LOC116946569 n=1 Tax=Petromyzon marinus TaxID=7757 RepID=UPI003F6EB09C